MSARPWGEVINASRKGNKCARGRDSGSLAHNSAQLRNCLATTGDIHLRDSFRPAFNSAEDSKTIYYSLGYKIIRV